ncbi:hypothetical protein V7201_17040 [Bacillus sp. JJ1122]
MKNRLFYRDENFIFTEEEGYPLPIKLVMKGLQRFEKDEHY